MLNKVRQKKYIAIIFVAILVLLWILLPTTLFNDPTSTVIEAENGELLGAKIADDGQWRFPHNEDVPEKFKKCIIAFEDSRFYYHLGVDILALVRAVKQNIQHGKIVSGGSTLSMQVIRLARKGKKRNFLEKIIEATLAFKLELNHSKKKILALYASNAPFGGNVVGLDAAAWRFFKTSPDKLSWAQAATLAVLPNSPSLIYPGKNKSALLTKRNQLLDKLLAAGEIDHTTCQLAKAEELPDKPYPLPQKAKHLLEKAIKDGFKGKRIRSTISESFQEKTNDIVWQHHERLAANGIKNIAVIIIEVETGEIKAYIGNIDKNDIKQENGFDVDIITAPRSTGSILKPFLFAMLLNDGILLPTTLVADIPTTIDGYTPKNYYLTYDGAVPAKNAIARSLNVPAVRLLQQYGIKKFNYYLKQLGMTTLTNEAEHYGLSIILGGAEGKLIDIAGIYARLAKQLKHANDKNVDLHMPVYNKNDQKKTILKPVLSASSIWLTFEAMVEVARPDQHAEWQLFNSSKRIAWKTGTSFGNRDAWAVGVTPNYVVGVWVGNADGEGRPNLTGIDAAAPILLDCFAFLPDAKTWFTQPLFDMVKIPVCRLSGQRASSICEPTDSLWVQKTGLLSNVCQYHKIVHLDQTEQFQVHADCEALSNIKQKTWFVLPPAMEWYFKTKNPFYKPLPPFRADCQQIGTQKNMELIYPKPQATIYFFKAAQDKQTSEVIFEAKHRQPSINIYWHIDEQFVGSTKDNHQLKIKPLNTGKHLLTIIDEHGQRLFQYFYVVAQ